MQSLQQLAAPTAPAEAQADFTSMLSSLPELPTVSTPVPAVSVPASRDSNAPMLAKYNLPVRIPRQVEEPTEVPVPPPAPVRGEEKEEEAEDKKAEEERKRVEEERKKAEEEKKAAEKKAEEENTYQSIFLP